jgi:hypothetical protein
MTHKCVHKIIRGDTTTAQYVHLKNYQNQDKGRDNQWETVSTALQNCGVLRLSERKVGRVKFSWHAVHGSGRESRQYR